MAKKTNSWLASAVILLIIAGFIWFMRPKQKADPTVSHGTLEFIPPIESQFIQPREVAVWLPEGYKTGDSCDVLYMHDGQMLFDAGTTWNSQEWRVDEMMDTLIKAGKIRPCIVVAIYNTRDRLNEYFPDKTWKQLNESQIKKTDTTEFKGDAYLKYIVNELKPYIDGQYKPLTSREHTFMMGSSMGGLISLYALCEYPQVFGGVACLSTHLSMQHLGNGIDDKTWPAAFRDYVCAQLPEQNGSLIYMDHGTKDFDADYGPYQERLDSAITSLGWDKGHYKSLVFTGDGHNETCWAKRLDQPLLFLLGK